MRNRVLWILQWVLGIFFIGMGVLHFIVPEGLPQPMDWMYVLSDTLHLVSGTAEILGGIGLILPAVTKIQPRVVPMAAVGLMMVMVGAAVWHIGRDELTNVGQNILLTAILAIVAYGRWRLEPLADRNAARIAT